jgi:hypothetical protein
MCSGMSVNAQNQFHDEHAPHNPALHITDEGLPPRARHEADLDSGAGRGSGPAMRLAGEEPR